MNDRLPSRDELIRFVEQRAGRATKRDLIRAFRVTGRARTELKRMVRELDAAGMLAPARARPGLPPVAVLEVTGIDSAGEPAARLIQETPESRGLVFRVLDPRRGPTPAVGDRILARLEGASEGIPEARIMRVLPAPPRRLVGVVVRAGGAVLVEPMDGRARDDLHVAPEADAGARAGELVVAERIDDRALGAPRARIVERLGTAGDPATFSLVTAHAYDLPMVFPADAEAQAAAATPAALDGREDLRHLPLVTIDGADARDFDDAVFASPDGPPGDPGGWRAVVAIADVAHYVRPGDALDQEALRRGNSVYFPDRVLPMLPEALSNGLCSLRPDEDRACLAVEMTIDGQGQTVRHRFVRGLMRSRARLTYEQVQAARDGAPDEAARALLDPVIRPLYGVLEALLAARRQRGTLDLDLPELGVEIDDQGRPSAIAVRPRLDAHRLIEELMIAANVAAAESLEQAGWPCMYRVHDRPDGEKLQALGELLRSLGLVRSAGSLGRVENLARLLARLDGHPLAPMISGFVLRAQSQAQYSPRNVGHFGLNLGRYAHFTSPIRRYADLLVHRALIQALGLGAGGLTRDAREDWAELGNQISRCERRAAEAERAARGRFVAALMATRIGAAFDGTVVGVHRAGLFVQLAGTLAEGLIPIGTLGAEYFVHDAAAHALIGDATGTTFALGDPVRVELAEADPIVGRLTFRLIEHDAGPMPRPEPRARRARRRPAPARARRGRR